jgi:DNA-binding NarL/FixJ family response regulator
MHRLSKRELELIRLQIGECLSYKEAAYKMGISAQTVGTYNARIHRNLGVRSQLELARWAIQNGICKW